MSNANDAFSTTRWTCVARARGESDESRRALSELCEGYYAPVHAFIRATVREDEVAKDLTQAFFERVFDSRAFDDADPERGRFRSFLLGAVKHFLWETKRRANAEKRGGKIIHEVLEGSSDTSPGFAVADPHSLPPDLLFDRRWAITVLQAALKRVSDEMTDAGRGEHFRVLQPWLIGDTVGLRQAEAAKQLGMNENALKVAVHRLRQRFRAAVKSEIAQTLVHGSSVEEELAYLETALRAATF